MRKYGEFIPAGSMHLMREELNLQTHELSAPLRDLQKSNHPFIQGPPIRLAEFGTVYPLGKVGNSTGLTRVRSYPGRRAYLLSSGPGKGRIHQGY